MLDKENIQNNGQEPPKKREKRTDVLPVSDLYENWFLDYASYVILDRAVPSMEDGLKPVQRRILHALKQMDDGRYHKVANAIGQTMQYHPHGDASIYEALVNLGQKDILIDTQGNWGDYRTGDSAAASRYIEARLSKFANEIVFNKDITEWQLSYDGRKKEPVNLPVKFPLLLAQGVEGIAVGLSTKILPHNFNELIKASIKILQGKKVSLYPDFLTGGLIDVSNYNGGKRGGKVRVRAKIEVVDKKTLAIKEIPYSTTTSSLIDSILRANDRGKIKIKKVVDNTAKDVEILVELHPNVSPDLTIDALYAFTNCEQSISPNCCVIINNKPHFLSVNELLQLSTKHTLALLKQELEVRLAALLERLHFASLEKIFIENRIYRQIEECETFEAVINTIDEGLKPFTKDFVRAVTRDDIIRLTEIKIKRISKYDAFKADDLINKLNDEIAEIRHHLANLTTYAVDYFEDLLKKYGKGRERKTEISNFDTIKVAQVAIANQKLYVDRKGGFIGYGLKKEEYVCDCSDIDDIIIFKKDGKYIVTKVADKVFVGKNIIHVDVWYKGQERKIYHAVYYDSKTGRAYVKRFSVTAITRDRAYDLTQGHKGSKLLYFSVHPNSEREIITIQLSPNTKAKSKVFEYDFGDLDIKNRNAKGNILSRYAVRKITQKTVGNSTLGGRKIWIDEAVGKFNTNERGKYLGEFDTNDTALVIHSNGSYELAELDFNRRFDVQQIEAIEKFNENTVVSVIYYHPEKSRYYAKRFKIETSTLNQAFFFMGEDRKFKLKYASTNEKAIAEYHYQTKRGAPIHQKSINFAKEVSLQGYRTLGSKLTQYRITKVIDQSPSEVLKLPSELKKKNNGSINSKTDKDKSQGSLF